MQEALTEKQQLTTNCSQLKMSWRAKNSDVIKGRDPQLERAVQEALTLLKTQAVELKPEPPAPVKYKRPVKK